MFAPWYEKARIRHLAYKMRYGLRDVRVYSSSFGSRAGVAGVLQYRFTAGITLRVQRVSRVEVYRVCAKSRVRLSLSSPNGVAGL